MKEINDHKLFYICYRIIQDKWSGYEVQIKRWYWPYWIQKAHHGCINSFISLDEAIEWINQGCPKEKEEEKEKKKVYWVKCD